MYTLDNGEVLDMSTVFFLLCRLPSLHTWVCVWVCVNWAFECIAPKAYIIGFTNYKAAFLWCCAKEYSEGSHIEGTPKRVYPLHIAQSGQLLRVFVYTPHEMLKHKNELVTHRTFANMVFFFAVHKVASYCDRPRPYIWMNINIFNNFVLFFLSPLRSTGYDVCSFFSLAFSRVSRFMWNTILAVHFYTFV